MTSIAPELIVAEEFIRRLISADRRGQCNYKCLSPGLPLQQVEEFFQSHFGYSCVETVNRMLGQGSLVAARPAPSSKPLRMQRPMLVDSVTEEQTKEGKHPRLYLPDDISNTVKRLWDIRQEKKKTLERVLTDPKLAPKGGENVVSLDTTKKKKN